MRLRALLFAGLASLAAAAPAQADTWNVNGTGDGGTCVVATHVCPSLRAALAASDATKNLKDVINVPAGTVSINNDLVVQSDVEIIGASARTTIIDGNAKYRGFAITSGGTDVDIRHLTVRNGAANGATGNGGGILNQGGVVELDHVSVTESSAGSGGGIANVTGTLVMTDGLIDGNTATSDSGGIANIGNGETRALLGIVDSTIFDNTAGTAGTGGINSRGYTGNIVILNRSTVADNVGGVRGVGGLEATTGAFQVNASIVARNLSEGVTSNCGAVKPTDGGFNVENDKECGFTLGGVNPGLGTSLANAGGELDVLALTAASPAVDRVPATATICSSTVPDQRGTHRPQGPGCDSGAYELNPAPAVTINSGPNGPIATRDVQFRYSTTEPGLTLECQLTGPGRTPGFVACDKPDQQTYSGLADGNFTFSVRATPSTVPNPPVSTRTFTVDTTPPDTTITAGPNGPTNDNTPTFSFNSTEAGTFQCSLDGGTFAACTSSVTTTALGDGAHTFAVRAIDGVNNTDPTPATRGFTVDTVAPNTTIATGPTGPTNTTTPQFTFTSTEAGTFQCSLDGAAFSTCPTPYTTPTLGQGAHTLSVRAVDTATNPDASPATRNFSVDTVAPDTTIATGPNGPTNTTTPQFTFTSSEAGTFQCSLDGAAFSTCPTPYTTPTLGQGAHTLSVRAVDTATNPDASPATRNFSVDTVAPDTTIATGPNGLTAQNSPSFTFTSPDTTATFECRLVGPSPSAAAPCASSKTYPGLLNGAYTLTVTAIDPAGNRDLSPATRTFTVDATPPDTTLGAGGPSGPTSSSAASFTFTADKAGSTFECKLDGPGAATQDYATCGSPKAYGPLADGAYTFSVRAIDTLGNVDPTTATRSFAVDTTPPPAEVVSGPEGTTQDTTPAFGFASSDPTTTFTCRLDGPAGVVEEGPCVSPKSFANLPPGTYTFTVRAQDAVGNVTTRSRSFTITVPQVLPGPTPSPTPTPGPPAPSFHQTIVVAPAGGTVLVRLKGTKQFVKLDVTKGIPLGSEVDTRKGRVRLSSVPKAGAPVETAVFYDGLFIVTQPGKITQLALSEKLAACPRAKTATAAAKKKPKTRKLWGDGKGSFSTKGQYSAATVRGTKWLVQDTCAGTLTRVAQGVVEVNDFVLKKKKLIKQGKRYTARPKHR